MKLHPSCLLLLTIIFLFCVLPVHSETGYNKLFTAERLRMDYLISGNAEQSNIISWDFYREPFWGGNRMNLIDTFRYGEMMVEVYDSASGELIFSKGYSTLFQEWQSVDEAHEIDSVFRETLTIPFPKKAIRIEISRREGLHFKPLRTISFQPADAVEKANPQSKKYELIKLRNQGRSEDKLDIVFLAEGYTVSERDSFFLKAEDLASRFLKWDPYKDLASAINIWALFTPSEESGVDDPNDSVWVNTALGCSFNTFGSDRYLTSTSPERIFDLVADIPYDQLCILVNTSKYGGGGIYNSYTFLSADSEFAEFLLLHEFGHTFAALADEYYTSAVAYSDFFNLEIEPYQANITSLINFESKWKAMLPDSVPIPTPDTVIYDKLIGVFEGAGYSAKGLYRPFRTCTMKSKYTHEFCPVCQKAISDMIKFHAAD